MPDVIKALRQYMLTKSAITSLLAQRIYQYRLPQNATLPAATMSIISEVYDQGLSGLNGIVESRIQLQCFATTAEASRELAAAIIWCGIDDLKGVTNQVDFRSVIVETGRREFEDGDTSGGDMQRHATEFDFMVFFLKDE